MTPTLNKVHARERFARANGRGGVIINSRISRLKFETGMLAGRINSPSLLYDLLNAEGADDGVGLARLLPAQLKWKSR